MQKELRSYLFMEDYFLFNRTLRDMSLRLQLRPRVGAIVVTNRNVSFPEAQSCLPIYFQFCFTI